MRPVNRGNAPTDNRGSAIVFKEYGDARDPLISRIGDYCSYYEVALHDIVHVEHVRPKSKHGDLERTWMGDYFEGFIQGESRRLAKTLAEIKAWTPPACTGGRRRRNAT